MRDIAKRLRGGDFRQAVKAVAALRHLDRASALQLIASIAAPTEEQRAFQLAIARLVAESGVAGLAARWTGLASPQYRGMLVSEIGQAIHLWADDGTIELLLSALDDSDAGVQRQAVRALIDCLGEFPDKARKAMTRTLRGKAALDACDALAECMTPARRARVAAAVTAALDGCARNPKALLWPDRYIELLGLSAGRTDQRALALLEQLRPLAGETRRSEFETLDPHNLPWPTSIIAEKKKIPPGTPFTRIWSRPTGLLDLQGLEQAIARIRRR